ncbi:MAG: energy transducer TonB [Burkholderiales bacterium]|nr:energy transducer TonB [Burkholderiales bacterium]
MRALSRSTLSLVVTAVVAALAAPAVDATPHEAASQAEATKVDAAPASARKASGKAKAGNLVAVFEQEGDASAAVPMSHADALLALEQDLSLKVGKYLRPEDYPLDARRSRWTGTAMVEVLVSGDGAIHDVSLARSSGFSILDDQALRIVRRVPKLFVPFQLRGGGEHRATVPIGFYLK